MNESELMAKFSEIPFDKIVKVGQKSMIHRDLFTVSWILGRYCNYRCSYCWPYARSDERDHRPLDVLIQTMDSIKSQARENGFNSFHFSWSGGEPTVHPQYLDLIKYYSDDLKNTNYQSCHMTTNLSRDIGWFKNYVEVTKELNRVSVTASWHREMAVKEAFRDKLLFLQENDVFVTINMVMVPEMFEDYYKEALFFKDSGINVTLKPQSNSTASKIVDGYSKEQLDLLQNGMPQRDNTSTGGKNAVSMSLEMEDSDGKIWYLDQAERLNAFEFNNFKGWKCHAGFQGVIIREPGGTIKRSYSCHDQPLGTIEEGFEIFKQPTPCISPSCVSSADSKIPKFKD